MKIIRPEQSQNEHDVHARYVDDVNEFEVHTTTLGGRVTQNVSFR